MFLKKIKLIDKILLGVIAITIDVSAIVDVNEVKNQKYLDLGYKYIVHIPRRNHILKPTSTNKSMIQEERLIISNRLFEGSSTSNLNGEGTFGGGQCVQFTQNVYYPLKIGKRLKIGQAYYNDKRNGLLEKIYNAIRTNSSNLPNGVRPNVDDCREGDIVAVDSGGGTGHIATFKNYNHSKLFLIQSNDDSDSLTMYGKNKEYETDKYGYHERFTFGNIHGDPNTTYAISFNNNTYSMTEPSNGSNTFVCFDPNQYNFNTTNYDGQDYRTVFVDKEKTGHGTTNDIFAITYGYPVDSKPWLYYLVNRDKDGVSKSSKIFTYTPDLLPVAPLRFNNENRMIGGKDSKYEIYATKTKEDIEFKLYEGEKLIKGNIHEINETIKFNETTFYKLKKIDTQEIQFVMIPTNGVNGLNNQRNIKVSSRVKMLFSPTVIDDYYIDWSRKNSDYNTSKIKIGFWNSYGYDIQYENTYIGGSSIIADRIYESSNAVNKYFMTLGNGKKAEWHFTLSGEYKFYVNVPTGNKDDIENAEYIYNGITLKATKSTDDLDSDFSNWYILSEENGNQVFDLKGSESVVVEAKNGTVVVDALKLVATTDTKKNKITYPDTKNLDKEYKKAIDYLSNTLPIFTGYNNGDKKGYFGVGDNISRAEVAKILSEMLKYIMSEKDIKKTTEADIKKRYTDWQEPKWFMDYARIVTEMNIMTGYFNEKKLKPKNFVTYREFSKMLGYTFFHNQEFKALWYEGTKFEKYLWHKKFYNCFNNDGQGYTYTDDDKKTHTISSIFKKPNIDSIPGNGWGEGGLTAKREDVALFLYRAYMLWKNKVETTSCTVDEENKKEGWGL